MIFYYDLTENDTDAQIFDVLEISPSFSIMNVEPPQNATTLFSVIDKESLNAYGYEIVSAPREDTISQEVHETLLSRSLVEFEDIWRNLAKK